MRDWFAVGLLLAAVGSGAAAAEAVGPADLFRLWDGPTKMVNALWVETPKKLQFGEGRTTVAVADLKGPGVITMIHFALPQAMKLNRDCLLSIYWDGEKTPSVQSPLVDFFCDPNGALERVNSALVNKKRGWNCYFPMPFRKSARVVVSFDNPRYLGGSWSQAPCYAYVMYRPVKSLPPDTATFHAEWRQASAALGQRDYKAWEAEGHGQFIGWNVTVRPAGSKVQGYPVDENEKFYVDGEKEPSIEFQGLEDSFGFSWGFPEQANEFLYTGYQSWYNGAAAFRFFLNDRISFAKSCRATIGFGANEMQAWAAMYPNEDYALQFSSVCYWYQTEPHKPFAPLPVRADRAPVGLVAAGQPPSEPGETAFLRCGHPDGDVRYLSPGWDFALRQGYLFNGSPWTSEIKHCRADAKDLSFDITCPQGAVGTLKLYLLDGDNFLGGRSQTVDVNGKRIGVFKGFQSGEWVDVPVSAAGSASGRIRVSMRPLVKGSNAVVTYVRFVQKGS